MVLCTAPTVGSARAHPGLASHARTHRREVLLCRPGPLVRARRGSWLAGPRGAPRRSRNEEGPGYFGQSRGPAVNVVATDSVECVAAQHTRGHKNGVVLRWGPWWRSPRGPQLTCMERSIHAEPCSIPRLLRCCSVGFGPGLLARVGDPPALCARRRRNRGLPPIAGSSLPDGGYGGCRVCELRGRVGDGLAEDTRRASEATCRSTVMNGLSTGLRSSMFDSASSIA